MKVKTHPVVVKQQEALGQYLREWRVIRGITAETVAQRARISRATLSRLENGATVGTDTLVSVIRVLGLSDKVLSALDPLNDDYAAAFVATCIPKKAAR